MVSKTIYSPKNGKWVRLCHIITKGMKLNLICQAIFICIPKMKNFYFIFVYLFIYTKYCEGIYKIAFMLFIVFDLQLPI